MSRGLSAERTLAVTPTQTSAVVAAAITQSGGGGTSRNRPRRETWTTQAWKYYDEIGELRYSTSWFANALSRSKFAISRRTTGNDYETVTDGPAFEALAELVRTGEAELLKSMGEQYFVPGEWYLVGRTVKRHLTWEVVSTDEISTTGSGKNATWSINRDDEDKIPLTASDTVIRMWKPHPQKRMKPDSPTRGAMGVLRQIRALSGHIDAQVYSRLAGAGLLLLPQEMTFAAPKTGTRTEDDPLLQTLMETMAAAMADPSDVSALVPILLKVPAETIDKIKHLTFWSELDQQAVPQLEASIRRLALGLDLPPEVLLGTADINHWGAWQIDESSIKAHIEPALGVICAGLTTEWLRPQLSEDIADDYMVTFDTSALRLRPNRSKEALELHDRGAINDAALRRETGFEADDAMNDEQIVRWLLLKMATGSATPEMVVWAANKLGADMPGGLGDVMRESRPSPSLTEHPEAGPPDPEDSEADASAVAALYATCETLVYRAMERAGNRLNNGKGVRPPGVDPADTHLYAKAGNAQLGTLLDGAWAPLARLMEGSPYHPDVIEKCLDSYCRSMLLSQEPYRRADLLRYVTAGMKIK